MKSTGALAKVAGLADSAGKGVALSKQKIIDHPHLTGNTRPAKALVTLLHEAGHAPYSKCQADQLEAASPEQELMIEACFDCKSSYGSSPGEGYVEDPCAEALANAQAVHAACDALDSTSAGSSSQYLWRLWEGARQEHVQCEENQKKCEAATLGSGDDGCADECSMVDDCLGSCGATDVCPPLCANPTP